MEIIKLINQKKSLLISLNILFILLVFTLLIWRSLNDALKKRSEMIFQQEVSEIQILIEERIDDYVNTLYGLRGLFAASNDLITREQWNIYCDQLNLKKHIPGIHSLSFNEYFTASDKQNFIKNIHKDCAFSEKGLPDFNIFTSVPINTQSDPPQLEFCVANYIWPWEENKVAFGHELFSDPVRGELLRKIRDNDHLGITTQFVLINDLGENTPAFGVYLPVYRSKKPLTSIRQRRTALCGFVAARFRAKDLIRSILLEYSRYPNIDLEIYDGETPVVEKLYYNDDDIMQAITPEYKSRFTSSSVLMLYNHPWILHFTAKPNFSLEKTHQNFPAVILILGISLSFIIAGSFYSLQTSRDRALLLANKITSQYEAQRALSIRSDRLRSLGQMAAGIAHELNQPLVGVRGLAETVDKYGRIKLDKYHYHGVPSGPGDRVFLKVSWDIVQILNQDYEIIAQYPRVYHQKDMAINWHVQFMVLSRKPGAVPHSVHFSFLPTPVQAYLSIEDKEELKGRLRLLSQLSKEYKIETLAVAITRANENGQTEPGSIRHELYRLTNPEPLLPMVEVYTPACLYGYRPDLSQYDQLTIVNAVTDSAIADSGTQEG